MSRSSVDALRTRPLEERERRVPRRPLLDGSGTLTYPPIDVPGIWGKRAPGLRAHAFDCGHFLAEERPDETTAELVAFIAGQPREATWS